MKPLIKWAGGKRDYAQRIGQLVRKKLGRGGTYYEPFAGGAAVALWIGYPQTVLSDWNTELMGFYDAIRRKPRSVLTYIELHCGSHCKTYYYNVRRWDRGNRYERAARFWYLNKAGFNGMYRVNKRGGFNVPIGRKAPHPPLYEDFLGFRRLTKAWVFEAGDFSPIICRARRGDVIYADPPYDGKFSYSSGFGAAGQALLAKRLRTAHRRGTSIIATNANTPLIRRLYLWARIEPFLETRRIAADPSRRQVAKCVLITTPAMTGTTQAT